MTTATFTFADGERVRCDVAPGQTILEAARAAGIALASECENGDCQTCRGTLASGRIDEFDATSLAQEDYDAGAVLICVTGALSDVDITLPYRRHDVIAPAAYRMTLSDIELASPTTARLRGELPRRGGGLRFLPGQYVTIALPDGAGERSYSMANAPSETRHLEFHIRLLPNGAMSDFIRNGARAGQTLDITGPYGTFYLRNTEAPILMVAGGTGLAPIMSILRSLAVRRSAQRIVLYYGVSRVDDCYGADELRALQQQLPGLSVHFASATAADGWTGRIGNATDLMSASDVAEAEQVYLCGPPAMITAGRTRIASFNRPAIEIYAEEFQPSGSA